ncbi:MAG: DciA family protein [Nitrospinota bacterium]
MIRKQDLNKNWSDLGSVLTGSLPENLKKDESEWWSYQWNLVVGKEISKISSIDKFTRGTLHVRVQGAEWLPSLESLKNKIIQELNGKAGKQRISKIKLITKAIG